MKFSKFLILALVSLSVFNSCTNDDSKDIPVAPIPGAYERGVFILNEGSSGQGSVSFVSNDLTSFTQDVYATVNGADLFGKYVQSMFFNGDIAYIIAGGSNKINVVNRKTFKLIAKIETGLVNPRYGVVVNGKAYVTNANTYSYANPATGNTDDFVAVINLTTNVVESTIPLNATANRIVLDSGRLYISEPYNNSNILVVNPTTNTLETSINVGFDADTIEAKDGYLYTLRSPFGGPSKLVKIKLSDSTLSEVVFPAALNDAKNLDIDGTKIYYTVGTSVYAMDVSSSVASTTSILSYTSASTYGKMYGFAVNNGRIYVADGGDFTANSKAYIYSTAGVLQKEMTVGVGPNGFYFNN